MSALCKQGHQGDEKQTSATVSVQSVPEVFFSEDRKPASKFADIAAEVGDCNSFLRHESQGGVQYEAAP